MFSGSPFPFKYSWFCCLQGNPNLCATTTAAGFFSSASHYSKHTLVGASIPPAFLLHTAPPHGWYSAWARERADFPASHCLGQTTWLETQPRRPMKGLCCRAQTESMSEPSGPVTTVTGVWARVPRNAHGPPVTAKSHLKRVSHRMCAATSLRSTEGSPKWAQSLKRLCYTWFTPRLFTLGTNPQDANTGGIPLNFISNGLKHVFLSALACDDIQTINSCSQS